MVLFQCLFDCETEILVGYILLYIYKYINVKSVCM